MPETSWRYQPPPGPGARSSGRRRLFKITVFVVTLAIGLGAFELICRAADVDFNPNSTRRFHPSWGWTQERSKQFRMQFEGHDVDVQFNALGFRDVEHQLAKPPGTKRLLILGDSFSEALQVNLKETYWHRVGELLKLSGRGDWEVINLGVGDWGTAQAYRALVELGLQYEPDVVLLEFFPLNDVCNNAIDLAGKCLSDSDSYRPYYVPTERGLELAWADPARQWLRSHLVSFGVIEKAYYVLRGEQTAPEATELQHAAMFETFVEGAEKGAPITRAWQTTEALLKLIDEACRARGIPWFPVIFPSDIQAQSKWTSFEQLVAHLKVVRDYPERRLAELARSLGTMSVPLLETFDEHEGDVLPYRGGHLNPAAHGLAAKVIFDAMVEARLAPVSVGSRRLRLGEPSARTWMRSGWSIDEKGETETYVWSDGPASVLELPIPSDTDVLLSFEARPYAAAGSPQQKVTVVLNGQVIQDVPLDAARRSYSVPLPRGAVGTESNVLEFRYAFTRRPSELDPGSADTRQLGVLWYSIELAVAASNVRFGDPAARASMRTGWSRDEGSGDNTYVWSDGPRSELQLPVPSGQDIRMDFSCQPFVYPGSPNQTVSVVINGTPVQKIELKTGLHSYSAVLPRAAIRQGLNTFEFVYGYTKRPDAIDANSGDTRQLGVAWHVIELTPVKMPGL